MASALPGGGSRAVVIETQPITPVSPRGREPERGAAWRDTPWTIDYPADAAARAYRRGAGGATVHGPFIAQKLAQDSARDAGGPLQHQRVADAYRAARDAGTYFLRGDMGIDLRA